MATTVTLDLTNIEEADDGNTTYYGGTYTFNDEVRRGYGNDRSNDFRDDIRENLEDICKEEWPDLAESMPEDLVDDLANALDDVENNDDHPGVGTITIKRLDKETFSIIVN